MTMVITLLVAIFLVLAFPKTIRFLMTAALFGTIYLVASSAHAADAKDVSVKQLNIKVDDSGVLVGVAVTSNATKSLGRVFVQCAALDGSGNLVATGLAQFQNLQPGETAYDFAPLLKLNSTNYDFKCRVDSIQDL